MERGNDSPSTLVNFYFSGHFHPSYNTKLCNQEPLNHTNRPPGIYRNERRSERTIPFDHGLYSVTLNSVLFSNGPGVVISSHGSGVPRL